MQCLVEELIARHGMQYKCLHFPICDIAKPPKRSNQKYDGRVSILQKMNCCYWGFFLQFCLKKHLTFLLHYPKPGNLQELDCFPLLPAAGSQRQKAHLP